ncbi:MAG: hypothetical protein PWP16_434 [Eubacteriaceae bacterium]|jgi:uncharacterized protein (DUF362 family)|nr:hypothetical protein [Eubacteriaceae bacterium]MDK2904036.1 hypothetical protein [Eubacteriaceae bacterium]MDK2935558.1 hypothetical protein [Eubacteriaceae bacterium]MDK2961350.1 hypothetical protein [Eubacteriaceae bacterium]MDN5307071.1 hypothetical protein [Eubacteriaceae bacterium]
MSKPKVAIAKVEQPEGNASFMGGKYIRIEEDVKKIKAAVAQAVELSIGSLDTIIKEGQTVLIKPNLAFQAPAESHAVVDPRTIEAVVSYVKENSKAAKVLVGDNPSLGMHVGRAKPAFKESKMEEAAYLGGADEVIYFDEHDVVPVDIEGAKLFKHATVFKPFLDADVVINLPKMKVHLAGTVTLGLKNWNGIIPNCHPNDQQQGAHRIDLGQKMADLYRIRKADLTIVDSVIGMEGQGPHAGTPIEMNLIVAGTDTVAVDSVACSIMGFEPMEIPAVRCAGTEGQGELDLDKIEVVGNSIESVMKHFKRPGGDPIGMYAGLTCVMQQTCPGCFVNVRGALDSFAISGIDMNTFLEKNGEIIVIAGGVPDLDPSICQDKHIFICGDCWELFPSADKVREGVAMAKSVTYYPGCAPVYIFAQLNGDLQKLAAGK